jgi:hypothetical protein
MTDAQSTYRFHTEPVKDGDDALRMLDDVDSIVRFCSVNMPDVDRYYRGAEAMWRVAYWIAQFRDIDPATIRAERDDADRRAGAAERQMVELKDSAAKRRDWLDRAKEAAGFHRNVSFDRVWEQALPLLLAARQQQPQPPAIDGMPVLDNGLNSVIEGALEIVRKRDPGMHGLIHNLQRLQEWLDLYVARAKAPVNPRAAWDWLASQPSLELAYHRTVYADDDDLAREWRVSKASGSINDREWEIVGRGLSPLLAIEDARNALAGEVIP